MFLNPILVAAVFYLVFGEFNCPPTVFLISSYKIIKSPLTTCTHSKFFSLLMPFMSNLMAYDAYAITLFYYRLILRIWTTSLSSYQE
jgi:hypothetical protein